MTAATTRFLLGRRGRHLYPLKSPTTLMGSSSQDGSPLNSHNSKNTASTTTTTLGRHGIPPPSNRNWNCRTKRSNNTTASMTPTYAYGFPPAAPSTTKWAFSPIVAVTLILLSFCFVGAYCLVLRIDSTIQESVSGGSSSSNAAAVRTMASSSLSTTSSATTLSRMMEKETRSAAILYMIPLYLNVTVFQIPCDELTVQVVQGDNQNNEQQASAVTDRLVFKTVMIDEQNQNQQSSSRIARTRARGLSSVHQHHVVTVPMNNNNRTKEAAAGESQMTTIVKQSVTTSTSHSTTTSNQHRQGQPALRVQQRRLEEQAAEDDDERQSQQQQYQQQDEEHTIHNSDAHSHSHHHHPTQGCQIKGHLQLPLGNAQRPAIVSIKSLYPRHHHHPQQHHDISLSHRIDKLKLGSSWKKFPMEETMLMDKKTKFKPTTYNDPHQLQKQDENEDAVMRVKHHYQVQQNFQIAEQTGSPTAAQQQTASENTPEIQLVFEPNQQE